MRARALFVLLLGGARAFAAVYTVAPSGGDFTTIQAALDVAVAGDTVQVKHKPTPYFEKLSFPRSGSAGAGPITLMAFPGDHPVLDGTGVPGTDMILIDGRSWVTVQGLEIRNLLAANDGSGIRVLGAGSHVELRDNDIHDIRGKNAMGITVYGTEPDPIADLVIDGNTIHDCEPAPSEALTLNGNVTGFAITNNVVRDVNNIGIDMIGGERDIQPDDAKGARNGVCGGNTVTRARSIYGGGYAGGIYVDGGRDIVVERNVVTESDLGLEVGAENHAIIASGNVVRDNLLYANEKAGLVFGGYAGSAGRVQGCEFRNNTLWGNDTLGTGNGEVWIQYASDNLIRNNLVVSTGQHLLLSSYRGNVDNTLDYDLWFTADGAPGRFVWNGTEYASFAAYASATGQDGASLFTDPLLGSQFHLGVGSPAINAGDPSVVPSPGELDLDGQPRQNGPRVDLGADEAAICGNGISEPGEQCDDGDLVSGDGCDANCTPTGCGNGIVTAGEGCDDGNTAPGDCCDAACQLEPPGSPCDDGNPCTTNDGCSAGACAGSEAPRTDCQAAPDGLLLVKGGAQPSLTWRWSGGNATPPDFGDPVSGGTSYTLCVYERTSGVPAVRLRATAPAGGLCGRRPCWSANSTGVKYKDRELTPSGILRLAGKVGTESASLFLKARGASLASLDLPLTQEPSVTVQLQQSGGVCWEATYGAPASRNDGTQFKDTPG